VLTDLVDWSKNILGDSEKIVNKIKNSYMSVEGGVLVLIMCGGMSYFDLN
jgi:hypothetical protein